MTKINNRPLLFCFLAFGLGIYFAMPIFASNVFALIFVFATIGTITFLSFKYKKVKRLMLVLVSFVIGICAFFISANSFGAKRFDNVEHTISGRIAVATPYDNYQNVIIDNVYVNGDMLGNNIKVFIYNDTGFNVGEIITFSSIIENEQLFVLGRFNSYVYKYNIPYKCKVSAEDVAIDSIGNLTFSEELRNSVLKTLNKNMDADEASVSFASLFGDKSYIEDEVKDSFSVVGIAHLLAVSGLHVGFVAVLISFILRKLKINKYVRLGLLATILGVYAYICSFSASIMRAVIMVTLMELAGVLGRRYERLNAWSIAGIICLLVKPLNVFDGGFLLSFACVLSIFMFSSYFNKLFTKWHVPNFLKGSLSVIIPVQFGILPLLANSFSEVSLLTVLANLICVPIFEIFFTMLFVCMPVVLMIPFLSFILAVPAFIISHIIWFAKFVSEIKWAIINLSTVVNFAIISFYIVVFVCSHYINLTKKLKSFICYIVLLLAISISVVSTLPVSANDNKITVINSYGECAYVLEIDNKCFCVGELNKHALSKVQQFANYSRLYKINYLINFGISEMENVNCFERVYDNNSINSNLFENKDNITIDNLLIKQIITGNIFAGICFEYGGTSIFIPNNVSLNQGQYLDISYSLQKVNLILGKEKHIKNYEENLIFDYYVADGYLIKNQQDEYLSPQADFSFDFVNNNVINMRGIK